MRRVTTVITLLAGAILAAMAAAYFATRVKPSAAQPPQAAATVHGYEIVREYPHDAGAFTQGLIYRDGFLYESTGLTGESSLRKVRLATGEVVRRRRLDDRYFGEGLTDWGGRLVQLTPMRTPLTDPAALTQIGKFPFLLTALGRRFGVNIGSIYDLASFDPRSTFSYTGEGWGLTRDDRRLIMSDGTSHIRFLDPDRFNELGRVQVTDGGRPVDHLNELELVNGQIYANVWFSDRIAMIRPDSGHISGWIDLAGVELRMAPPPDRSAGDVLNGIAYDAAGGRLFVTGKRWPRLFEIRLRAP
jgi:glutamine cyclotransferase